MTSSDMPPGPVHRSWHGKNLSVHNFYSVAGISTSFFFLTPVGTILCEAGDGCTRDLIELKRELEQESCDKDTSTDTIQAIVISHQHYDHYAGLLNLLNLFHLTQRKDALKIIYPKGSKAIEMLVDHFIETLWEECPFKIDMIPMDESTIIDLGGIILSTIPVLHRYSRPGRVGNKVPAMAYSIRSGEERISYSGDTCGSLELDKFMEGSDLALVEATYAKTPSGHEEVHLDLEKAVTLASMAKEHWLVHFTSASYSALSKSEDLDPGVIPTGPRGEIP